MAIQLEVEMAGQEKLIDKLSDPAVIAGPLKDLLEEASAIGRKTAELGIDGGTGIAVRSIGAELKPLSARVFTAMAEPRASSIEKGRPPGDNRWTSDRQMQNWVKANQVGRYGRTGTEQDLVGTAFVIAREIRRRGVKGRFFMQAAREKVQSELPRLLSEMATKIQQMFGR